MREYRTTLHSEEQEAYISFSPLANNVRQGTMCWWGGQLWNFKYVEKCY